MIEPDGTERIVEYTADDVHGFNAVVTRIKPGQNIVPYELPVIPVAPVAPVVFPLDTPYKSIYTPMYKNGYGYRSGSAYSYQNIEQYS